MFSVEEPTFEPAPILATRRPREALRWVAAVAFALATTAAFAQVPDANYEGLWWASPAGSESGWGINFAHQGDVIFATWFTYDAAGKPWWLTVTANQTAAGIYGGTLYETRGPAFSATPFDPAAVTATAVGNATIAFTDANTATFDYTVKGTHQTKTLTREVFGTLPTCSFGALANLALAGNYQDLWWAAPGGSESGWGINLTQQGDTIFGSWFTYDVDGSPLWLVVAATLGAPGTYTGTLYRTIGPAFGATPFDPKKVLSTAVGTATFTFADGAHGTFSYTITGVGPAIVQQAKPIVREVFRAPGTTCFSPGAPAPLIPSADGLTVYDTIQNVRWLADANPAAATVGNLGVAGITPNGSMNYGPAVQWIAALNALNAGAGYLGHNDWTLPTTPMKDATCKATGPQGNSFGFNCMNSAMGSLYYRSLRLHYPDTAVPIPDDAVGPFTNFQPYLYWYDTLSGMTANGYSTFSFNTGWSGSNVDGHYIYALPMIPGQLPGSYRATGVGELQVSADGRTVYDPAADVTWLADADLARTQSFGAQCVNPDGTLCINPDGSMSHTTAEKWIAGMNAYAGGAGWLGQTRWQLPPTDTSAPCGNPASGCPGRPMLTLFYKELGLKQGTPVVPTPHVDVGPFHNVQPYLYWSCMAPDCSVPPAPGFGWSFSFGNGFQGTDVVGNNLYVMANFPQTAAQALTEAIRAALGASGTLDAFLSQATAIASAPNAAAKAAALGTFIASVTAQRGKALTSAQADELVALAQAN